jgi:uncharacterized protein (TIGR03067 family)
MKSSSLVASAFAVFDFVAFVSTAPGQGRPPAPAPRNASVLEKRVGELERQLAALRKELTELRQGLRRPQVTIIPLEKVSAANMALAVQGAFPTHLSLTVEALPKMNCIAVQADAKTIKEVKALIADLEASARIQGKVTVIVIPPNRPDPAIMRQLIRMTRKAWAETAKAERAKREGAWVMMTWEENGLPIPAEETRKWKMVLKGDAFILLRDGKEMSRGTHRIDVTKYPYREDCTVKDGDAVGQTYLGIYAIEDRRFIGCYATKAQGRPEGFKPGPGKTLIVWERERK